MLGHGWLHLEGLVKLQLDGVAQLGVLNVDFELVGTQTPAHNGFNLLAQFLDFGSLSHVAHLDVAVQVAPVNERAPAERTICVVLGASVYHCVTFSIIS